MNSKDSTYRAFIAELSQAEVARQQGNEGKARVCSRRAVGILLGAYLERKGIQFQDPSALARTKFICNHPATGQRVKTVLEHFLVRVTPEHSLPINADLIAEARWLAGQLIHW